jgi:predicted MFS family arabinose efflux permease
MSLFVGMTQAFIPTIISRVTPGHSRGESLGINTSVSALAQAIPAILAGYIAANIDITATIAVASLLMAVGGIVFWLIFNPKKIVEE